jgi:hypothetical protein
LPDVVGPLTFGPTTGRFRRPAVLPFASHKAVSTFQVLPNLLTVPLLRA